MIGIAVAAVMLAAGWYFLRGGASDPLGGGETSEKGKAAIKEETARAGYEPGRDRELESAAAGGVAGAAIGSAILPGIGTAIGAAIGFMVSGIIEAIGHESYGQEIRTALASWLRRNGAEGSSAQVDALLFRNCLLASRWIWVDPQGALFVEVTETRHVDEDRLIVRDRVVTSLTNAARSEADDEGTFIPGPAHAHIASLIERRAYGQLDGPNQVRDQRAWAKAARVGQFYKIEWHPAQKSWRTEHYLFFGHTWPLLARSATRKGEGWSKVTVGDSNVDSLSAGFDRAAGLGSQS